MESAFNQAMQAVQNFFTGGSKKYASAIPVKNTSGVPLPTSTPMKVKPNYEQMITQAYQKYGATPELMKQIPTMAKQIQKNPYLYPYYPAIPIAETSGGKGVSYPGNYFNLGVTLKPYPLNGYSPEYITERTAWRMTTDPKYKAFRDNPSIQSLQPIYAPVASNPHWASNMQAAIGYFPQ